MKLVHKNFKLNSISFSSSAELIEYSKNISESLFSFCRDWFSSSDIILVKTSGSTGKPKDIELKKKYMINSAKATGNFFNLFEKTTALCCLPIEYIAGKMMIVRALTLGWHIDVIEPRSNPLNEIDKTYDFSAMVPLQLKNSLKKLHLINQLIVGGGAVSYDLEQKIQGLSTKIYATYGMTETITHIAIKELNGISSEGDKSHYELLPSVKIYTDSRGCLVIDAPNVSDETVITNDIVDILSDKEFQWKGRFDNVINSGGVKLHPEEIEKKLSPYITKRFFVAGVPDEVLGEKLILLIESPENSVLNSLDFETFKKMKHSILDKYEIPKEIFFLTQFVETQTSKIQRKQTLSKIQF